MYVDIVSLPADSKDTVLRVLRDLHTTFIIQLQFRWLMVVGDAKTYDILHGRVFDVNMEAKCSGCSLSLETGRSYTITRKSSSKSTVKLDYYN